MARLSIFMSEIVMVALFASYGRDVHREVHRAAADLQRSGRRRSLPRAG